MVRGRATLAEIPEPNAMALATATPDGRPSVRIVLLRGYDERGFTFFTNYESRKGRELEANPRAALVFHWHDLERQVRIEGPVERVSAEESDAYFQSRPAGSRLGAWASRQSEVIPDRAELEARARELDAPVSRRPDPSPRALGRLPGDPRGHRVLARPAQPAARPAAIFKTGPGVDHRAAVAMIPTHACLLNPAPGNLPGQLTKRAWRVQTTRSDLEQVRDWPGSRARADHESESTRRTTR